MIIDHFAAEGFEEEVFESASALHLGMRTLEGRAHDETTLRGLCRQAGLSARSVLTLRHTALRTLVCRRREARADAPC